MRHIYIVGPFKSATSTLEYRFQSGLDQDKYKSIKSHWFYDFTDDYDTIVIPLRDPEIMYKSAFFQDITDKSYPYFYSEEQQNVLSASIEDLVNHYYQFDFSKYYWLNYDNILEYIKENYDIGDYISQLSYDKKYFIFRCQKTNKLICFYYTNFLNDENIFREFLNKIEIPNEDINGNVFYEEGNIGKLKWYGDKYNDFLKIFNFNNDKNEKYKEKRKMLGF
jgi:hypothetical protein